MRNKISIIVLTLISILSLFSIVTPVAAKNISDTETCNVQVSINATVPDSVVQGQSFNLTNFTVQPSDTYGFNVTSSTYYLSATNTPSSTYTQDFYATNPSPTTGHSTYIGYYPNWTLNATGPVGSSVTISLIKSVTVIQGYGGSPVTCNFNKTLTSVPITAAAAPPPSPSSSPSSQPSSSPSSNNTKVSVSGTVPSSPSPSTSSASEGAAVAQPSTVAQAQANGGATEPDKKSVSVIPLNIKVVNSSGKAVAGAEVTLDSSKDLITGNDGKVVFSNVLTGTHAILVSYDGLRTSSTVNLGNADVGKVESIQLPAPKTFNSVVIGAGALAAAAVIVTTAGFLFLRHKRQLATKTAGSQSDVTIHGIIDGSAVPIQADTTIEHIPAIQIFDAQPATVSTPAPWDPASITIPSLAITAPGSASDEPAMEQPIDQTGKPQPIVQHFASPTSSLTTSKKLVVAPTIPNSAVQPEQVIETTQQMPIIRTVNRKSPTVTP